jgi:hypothetical protein
VGRKQTVDPAGDHISSIRDGTSEACRSILRNARIIASGVLVSSTKTCIGQENRHHHQLGVAVADMRQFMPQNCFELIVGKPIDKPARDTVTAYWPSRRPDA